MTKSRTKKVTRFFAIFMATILLAMCVPTNVFGSNDAQPLSDFKPAIESTAGESLGATVNEGVSVIEGDVIGEYVEDVSRREENVKHFALPDGTYTAIVYPTAVHRKDADGVWQDINNDLALSSVKGMQKYATTDSRVSFAQSFSPSAELMTLFENGYSISMSLISDSKNESVMRASTESFGLASVTNAAKKELPKTDVKLEDVAKVDNKSSIVYNNVRANTDIEYILDGNDVKENIIVRAASSEYEYTFDLRLDGLVAILNENGSISINDAETGAAKYIIPAPYMYDANGEISYAVEYTIVEASNSRYLLMVTAYKTWINSTGRAFPVTIDPTIETLMPIVLSSDTYISQSHPDENYCGAQDLVVGEGYTALISLQLPNLPDNTTMTNAYLYFTYYFETCFPEITQIAAYQITSGWNETVTTYNSMPVINSTQLSSLSLAVDEYDAYELNIERLDISTIVFDWYYNNVVNNGIAIMHESGIFNVNIKSYDSGSNYCEFLCVNYSLALPTSRSEIVYCPSDWNYGDVQRYTNCYSYALNCQINPLTNLLEPLHIGNVAKDTITHINVSTIIDYVEEDAEKLGIVFRQVEKREKCSSGTYKVALVMNSVDYSYHWYRQNSDGTWSHKPGQLAVTNLDADQQVIYDPAICDRYLTGVYYYDYFVGYFEVSPLNTMYTVE